MVRAGIVYTLLVLAFFLLVIFSNQPKKDSHSVQRRGPRRLILRQTKPGKQNTTYAAFDPIIAEMEWKRENREWEREYFRQKYKVWDNITRDVDHQNEEDKVDHHDQNNDQHVDTKDPHHDQQHEKDRDHHYDTFHQQQHAEGHEEQPSPWDSDMDDHSEDYLNDESHFNISSRLELLFPQLDVNPKDMFVSLGELQDWHVQQAEKLAMQRVGREFDVRDKNHDGVISLHEYLPQFSAEELVNGSTEHGQAGWWREHFELADIDADGTLNRTEFADFLHPEDSHNPKLLQWLRKEQISENDHDKDGKLSLEEFNPLFDILRYYGEDLSHLHQGNDAEARKEKFEELDKNKDGFLTEDELEPIITRLHPGEAFYAKQQAQYLIEQADEDKDGRLTLKEMLDHPYVFYSTAYTPEDWPEEVDHDHDEFR